MSPASALRSAEPAVSDSDYDSILAALMETARGRWFLQEYASRNRNADTQMLLTAIGRLETMIERPRSDVAELKAPYSEGIEPDKLLALKRELTAVLDNFIECGAPTYLCNDMAQCLNVLTGLVAPQTRVPASGQMPIPAVDVPSTSSVAQRLPAKRSLQAERRDPFADIRALSPAERIALFT